MALAVLGLGVIAIQPRVVMDGFPRLAPGVLWSVPTTAPVGALTFDDGPDPRFTPQVLDLLKQHGVKATFFLIGAHAEAHPALVSRLRDEGHERGNHWVSRRSTLMVSDEEFLAGLESTHRAIGPGAALLFRPPGGLIRPSHRALAARRGYTTVLGSAYPYDPQMRSARYIRWLVKKNLGPGGIAILHDGGRDQSATVAALDGILTDAAARGLRLVTVSELMTTSRRASSSRR